MFLQWTTLDFTKPCHNPTTPSFPRHRNLWLISITFCSFNSQNKSSLISPPGNIVLISLWQFTLQPHTRLNPTGYSVWEVETESQDFSCGKKAFEALEWFLQYQPTPFWNEYHSFSQPRFRLNLLRTNGSNKSHTGLLVSSSSCGTLTFPGLTVNES